MTHILTDRDASAEERLVAAGALARSSDDAYIKLLSLAILVTSAARNPYGVAANGAIASLAGVDATSGNGIQKTAKAIIESEKFEALNLDADFIETLHEIASGDINWGKPKDRLISQ